MAKPQVKKSLETFNQELAEVHMTGQWIYEDLLNRAIGGPRPRGDAYLWPWPMVHEKLARGVRRARRKLHGAAQRAVRQSGPERQRDDAHALDGRSDDQARRDRLGASAHAGGDSLRDQRRRQSFHRRRRREVPDGALRFDSHAAVDLARSPQSDPRKRDLGRRAGCAVFARTEPALLRALSRQQRSDDSREGRRSFTAARRRCATDMGKHQERKSAAALRLERYRAATARARRSGRAVPTTAWRWSM